MKTHERLFKRILFFALIFFKVLNVFGQGIKIRPTSGTSTSGYSGQTPIPQNSVNKAFDNDESTYTELESSFSVGYAISPYLHLNYQNPVPADKPFYVKIAMNDSKLLDKVAGGVVGDALNNILSGLIGGIPNTQFALYNASNQLVFEAETESFNTVDVNKFRFVRDVSGNYYARFQPGVAFSKLSSRLYTSGAVVTGKWTRFYDAFYYGGNEDCPKTFTYVNATKDLLTAVGNTEPVVNLNNAIDGDLSTFSSFGNQGVVKLGLGKSIEQIIELPTSTNSKKLQIKMQMPTGLLGVGVGSGVSVIFYKGNVALKEVVVDRSILNVDLLGLINAGNNIPFTVTIDPPVDNATKLVKEYDKIGIKMSEPIGIDVDNLSDDLKLYEVSFVDVDPQPTYVCAKIFTINGGGFEKKFDITSIIPGFVASDYAKYTITNHTNQEIVFQSIADIENKKWQPLGQYLIRGMQQPGYCSDQFYTFLVEEDRSNKIEGSLNIMVPLGSTFDFSTLSYTSNIINSQIKIFDETNNANVTNSTKVFDQLGTFNYYVKASNATENCEVVKLLKFFVFENESCDYRYVKRMATSEDVGTVSLLGIPLGGSNNSDRAADDDLSTCSEIFNAVSIAGIGTTWQDLKFNTTIPQGTPVTIKLGHGFGVAQVIGGITFRAINANGQAVGKLQDIQETDLLTALVGDNVFEYTFVPTDAQGNPIDYSGVRVHLGSLLGLLNNMNIYGAYVEERLPISSTVCQNTIEMKGADLPNIQNFMDSKVILNNSTKDVLWGVKDTGLVNATSVLSNVLHPYLAVDQSYEYKENGVTKTVDGLESHAIFNTSLAVNNAQVLSVKLKDVARPGDKIRIIMGSENVSILDLNLLQGFSIQRYMGNYPVGDPITSSQFSLINLNVLGLLGNTNSKTAVIINSTNIPYDRVDIVFNNVVSVQLLGQYTYIYDVSVVPGYDILMGGQNLEMCTDKVFDVSKTDLCSSYNFSLAFKKLSANSTPTNPIYEWVDIPESVLNLVYSDDQIYRYRIPYHETVRALYQAHLYEIFEANTGNLYLKATTNRQGCQYGDSQYFKVGYIGKCFGTGTNPFTRQKVKSY